jgi:hypothetical protein
MADWLIWWASSCWLAEDWAALRVTYFEPQETMELLPNSTAKQQKTTVFTLNSTENGCCC